MSSPQFKFIYELFNHNTILKKIIKLILLCNLSYQLNQKELHQVKHKHNELGDIDATSTMIRWNKNIDASLTYLNTCIVNNPKDGETYLTAFNRRYESGEFKGQMKVQGADEKQTKFVDEFLVYPPNEKITEMSLEEQESLDIMNKALNSSNKKNKKN